MRYVILLIACLVPITSLWSPAARWQELDLKQMLRVDHPRLLVLDEDVARLKQALRHDPTAQKYFDHIKMVGDELLGEPVSQRVVVGPRLLHVSRQVLGRVTTLAGLYRLTDGRKYADRARDELLAAARFEDWNPSHFLDVAEMTNAMGIGYDWLFDVLTPDERATIRQAIVEKGLKPGLEVYGRDRGWHKSTNNWNQVCNGGLTVGALAIADEEPELAVRIIVEAKKSLPRAMAAFSDGGCIEGPSYWGYATRYIAYCGSAMQTALGDMTILYSPGLNKTGMFRIQSISPINRTFNFADGGESAGAAPQMFYFARVFDAPAYAVHERLRIGPDANGIDPLHLLWFNAEGTQEDIKQLPRAANFDRIKVAFFRSVWGDAQAAFVGFKGGDNAASHANLDLGTFVYDVEGVRWAIELGPDDYNLPGYFGGKRWTYYRLRTDGQNTLTLNGENQNPKAKSKLVAFSGEAENLFAVADLSDAYAGQAKRVRRRVSLAGRQLMIEDELSAAEPVEVVWHMHTAAKIVLQPGPGQARLSQDDKHLIVQILEPADARFEIAPADPVPAERPNPPMRRETKRLTEKLVVRLPEKVTELRLKVLLAPGTDFTEQPRMNLRPTTRPSHTPATRP